MSTRGPRVSSGTAQPSTGWPGDTAASAAHYVVHSRRFSTKEHGIDGYGAYVAPKEAPQYDLASAGAAASLAQSYRVEEDARRPPEKLQVPDSRDRGTPTEEARLRTVSSKAASLAVRGKPQEGTEKLREEYHEDDPGAKVAATSAITGSRRRAESRHSALDDFPDLAQAVSAATTSHKVIGEEEVRVEGGQQHLDGGRIHHVAVTNTQRDLYTSHPPVDIEVEEKKKEETRHAAVISMARQMYATMPRAEEAAAAEVSSVSSGRQARRSTLEGQQRQQGPSGTTQPSINLHAVAERRVAEQLEKLNKELAAEQRISRPYQDVAVSPRPRSSTSPWMRRWSSNESDAAATVQRRSQRKPFQPRPVEEDKAAEAPDNTLMATAQRNTNITIGEIDRHIYDQSGKPSPAKIEEWERRAHERKTRTGEGSPTTFQPGAEEKMEGQRDVEDVARQRIKPTLHAIDDKVDERRGRAIAKQLDADEKKRQLLRQKQRDLEVAKIEKKVEKMNKKDLKKSSKDGKGQKKAKVKADKKARQAEKKAAAKGKSKGQETDGERSTSNQEDRKGGKAAAVAGAASKSPQHDGESADKPSTSAPREPAASSAADRTSAEPTTATTQQVATGPTTGEATTTGTSATEGVGTQKVERGEGQSRKPTVAGKESRSAAAGSGEPSGRDGEQESLSAVRQWSTSPTNQDASQGEQQGREAATEKTTATPTTTKRQSHSLRTLFFGRSPRNTTGRQGSFEVQPRTGRNTIENGSTPVEAEPRTTQSTAGRTTGVSRFQENF